MSLPTETSMLGFSASLAYEYEETDGYRPEEPPSDSAVETIADQRCSSEAVPPTNPSDKNFQVEFSNTGVLLNPRRTRATMSSPETTMRQRPRVLQNATSASAPEIRRKSPPKETATTGYGTSRSVSEGQSTVSPENPKQSPKSIQRMRNSGSPLPVAFPSTNKRRRSDQDAIQETNVTFQGGLRVRAAPSHSRSVSSNSSSSSRHPPCSQNLEETSKGSSLESSSDSGDEDNRPSPGSSDTAVGTSTDSRIPQLGRGLSVSAPLFVPKHTDHLSVARVTHKVFETMQRVLSAKEKSDNGYIYTLRMVERPGFVKIGRTQNPIDKRKKQINRCIRTYNLEAMNDDDFCLIENHTRVEKLIHDQLRSHHREFSCPCKGKTHKGDVMHGEWFEIDEAKAIEVVTRWRAWMLTKPYLDGKLIGSEKFRINIYQKDADRMNAMTNEEDDEWRWHIFMSSTPWPPRLFWLHEILFGERYVRSTCSRWESLWKHWKSNVLFGLAFFLLSCFLSVLSYVLPLSFAFAPPPAVLNTMVLGSGAILYAA